MKKLIFILLLAAGLLLKAQEKTFAYDMSFRPNPLKDDVLGQRSIFRTESEKKYDSILTKTGNSNSLEFGLENHFYVIKDLKTNTVEKFIQNFRDHFLLKIDEKLIWKIEQEQQKIGNFNCQKATAAYGGRNWTAWFSSEIPLQEGPYIFHGLPGLIIKISDDKNDYNFVLTQIKKFGGELFFSGKPLPINWKVYQKLALDYYADPYKNMKPNSAGMGATVKVKYTDESGAEIQPNFAEWTKKEQRTIRENNNPIELNYKINYH